MMDSNNKIIAALTKAIITNTEVNAHCISFLSQMLDGKKVDHKKFSATYSKIIKGYNKAIDDIKNTNG